MLSRSRTRATLSTSTSSGRWPAGKPGPVPERGARGDVTGLTPDVEYSIRALYSVLNSVRYGPGYTQHGFTVKRSDCRTASYCRTRSAVTSHETRLTSSASAMGRDAASAALLAGGCGPRGGTPALAEASRQ
eukprot:6645139-Prymnesium_polylepis.1